MTYRLQPAAPALASIASPHGSTSGNVLIVTGRLPWALVQPGGRVDVRHRGEALPPARADVWRKRRPGSRWIGWTGLADRPEHDVRTEMDTRLRAAGVTAIHLSRGEVTGFYHRYSNGVLRAVLDDDGGGGAYASDWDAYRAVNARFADAIAAELRVGDLVWVHDYHLMLVPRLLRNECPWARIHFFLHAPFPSVDTFARLPTALRLLDGVLGADAIEMRSAESVWNFLAAVNATRAYDTRSTVIDDCGRAVCVYSSSKV
jgi:trehalose 6-phosphate synthase/phosphatase